MKAEHYRGATVNQLASVKAVAAAFAWNYRTSENEQHAVSETRMETGPRRLCDIIHGTRAVLNVILTFKDSSNFFMTYKSSIWSV